jgi:hypothetical protein
MLGSVREVRILHTGVEEKRILGPITDVEKEEVRRQMERLLATSHFKNSRRYPALFRFIVEEALEGRGEFLKERLLGVRVFDRPADYDTAADPIVRVTIAEIRKRIAQYYHEEAHDSEMRIELLPGSYTPEFRPRRETADHHIQTVEAVEVAAEVHEARVAHTSVSILSRISVPVRYGLVTIVLMLLATAVYMGWLWTHSSPVEQLWRPILASSEPITFFLPLQAEHHEELKKAASMSKGGVDHLEEGTPTFLDYMSLGENVVFSDMVAMQHISNMLARQHHEARLRMNASTTFDDLRQGPAILIGGLDNQWTMRAISSLRYRFEGSDETQYCITDTEHPEKKDWCVRFKARYPLVTHDYAIIARIHNESTGQLEFVVAGIGMSGTAAAGEFLVNPQQVEELRRMVGRGFADRDFEAVLSTDVVNGVSGSPRILAVTK